MDITPLSIFIAEKALISPQKITELRLRYLPDSLRNAHVVSRLVPLNGINVKKNCSLSTTYNGEMTHRKQQK